MASRPDLASVLLLVFASSFLSWATANTYNVGDYVPVSRQAQFHNMRTHWHDLIGRYCPRFGIDREVVLPIPKPIGFSFPEDSYKMKLSFGKERFVSGWLLLMSRNQHVPPVIHITLSHFAGEFRGIKARAISMSPQMLTQHQLLVKEWNNETHWPKHAIIVYRWREHAEVDVTAGLILLFGTSFSLTTILAIYILQSSKDKLSRFMSEQLAETPASAMPGPALVGGAVPKVD